MHRGGLSYYTNLARYHARVALGKDVGAHPDFVRTAEKYSEYAWNRMRCGEARNIPIRYDSWGAVKRAWRPVRRVFESQRLKGLCYIY
jgi:hypothetical protein